MCCYSSAALSSSMDILLRVSELKLAETTLPFFKKAYLYLLSALFHLIFFCNYKAFTPTELSLRV